MAFVARDGAGMARRSGRSQEAACVFVEQSLARPFTSDVDPLNPSQIRANALPWSEVSPAMKLAVCAIDVQQGWLSVHVIMFASQTQGIVVERVEMHGDIDYVGGSAWEQCKTWIRTHKGYRGYPISLVVVDTGYQSDITVQNAARLGHPKVFFVKGDDGWNRAIYTRSKNAKVRGLKYPLYMLGVDGIKVSLRKWFGNGQMRILDTLPETVERELVSEELKEKKVRGRTTKFWDQIEKRNECLDACVYAVAAIHIAGHNSETIGAIQPAKATPATRRRTPNKARNRLYNTGRFKPSRRG